MKLSDASLAQHGRTERAIHNDRRTHCGKSGRWRRLAEESGSSNYNKSFANLPFVFVCTAECKTLDALSRRCHSAQGRVPSIRTRYPFLPQAGTDRNRYLEIFIDTFEDEGNIEKCQAGEAVQRHHNSRPAQATSKYSNRAGHAMA